MPSLSLRRPLSVAAALLFCSPALRAAEATEPSCDDAASVALQPDPNEVHFGAKIPRTAALLATSSPTRRHTVKILIYGQSISAGMERSCLQTELRRRFPHARIVWENRAISGFSANQLVRSASLDLPLSYPDLVIFHVYGQSAIEYERILADIRRRTTAEIMIWTDHYGNAGVPGDDEYRARAAREDEASAITRALAVKYHCELVDARPAWKAYIDAAGLRPADLLSDNVHLNARGKALMTAILLRHFRLNPASPHDWMNTVRTFEAKRAVDEGAADEIVFTGAPWKIRSSDAVGTAPGSALKLTFTGNRIDLIPGAVAGLKPGTARILIDGRPPSAHPELYAFTRPSPAFGADYQPGIRRVSSLAPLLAEDWVLRITAASDDGFAFEVHGSKTGFDGAGRFALGRLKRARYGFLEFAADDGDLPETFVSDSRRIVIDHRDFKVLWGQERAKQLCPVGWEITWKVVPQFLDTYTAAAAAEPGLVAPVTLAQGLPNREHTVEIIPNGDGAIPIRELVVHRPPLR